MEIVVVGAGIAGLTAAYNLQKLGHKVVVLEAERYPSGRAGSDLTDGIETRRGAEFLIDSYTETKKLAKELGLPVVSMGAGNITILDDKGKALKINRSSLVALLQSPFLSLSELFTIAIGMPRLFVTSLLSPSLDSLREDSDYEGENTEIYARKLFGDELYEKVIEPIGYAPFRYSPSNFSKAFFLSMVKEIVIFGGMRYKTFPGELYQLGKELSNRVEIEYNSTVQKISRVGSQVRIMTQGDFGEKELLVDHVVIAVPGEIALSLLASPLENEIAFLSQVKYGNAIEVFYEIPEVPKNSAFSGDTTYLLLPVAKHLAVCAVTINNRGKVCIAEVGLRDEYIKKHNLLAASDKEIEQVVAQELVGILDEKRMITIRRWQTGLPRYPSGTMKKCAQFLENNKTDLLVSYCGDYLYGPYVEGAVRSAIRCVKKIQGS